MVRERSGKGPGKVRERSRKETETTTRAFFWSAACCSRSIDSIDLSRACSQLPAVKRRRPRPRRLGRGSLLSARLDHLWVSHQLDHLCSGRLR